jgi:hypothetical protein
VGADTRVVFSGTDYIILKNVLASTVTDIVAVDPDAAKTAAKVIQPDAPAALDPTTQAGAGDAGQGHVQPLDRHGTPVDVPPELEALFARIHGDDGSEALQVAPQTGAQAVHPDLALHTLLQAGAATGPTPQTAGAPSPADEAGPEFGVTHGRLHLHDPDTDWWLI